MEDSNNNKPYDVFISHKSADAALAKELYVFLKKLGFKVFFSQETLPKLGGSDYRKAIDQALDECSHMIVVGSSVENIKSSWVEAEWGLFINEKRSNRKQGNIITVITENLKIEDLPSSLRYYEVIIFKQENFSRIAGYLGIIGENQLASTNIFQKLLGILKVFRKVHFLVWIILIGLVISFLIIRKAQPFDATIVLKTSSKVGENSIYPKFDGGELSIYPANQIESKFAVSGQEVVYKQIPAEFKGKKIFARLVSDYWKLSKDTIELGDEMSLEIIPNGKLANIFGNVKDLNGNPIADCKITIDTDTLTYCNSEGIFQIELPINMQKSKYTLSIICKEYQTQRLDYFAGSGNIDIVLKR